MKKMCKDTFECVVKILKKSYLRRSINQIKFVRQCKIKKNKRGGVGRIIRQHKRMKPPNEIEIMLTEMKNFDKFKNSIEKNNWRQ